MVSGHPPILNLRLNSRPESAGLIRAALGGLATPFRLRAELVGDLKTTISEACNNAVERAYRGQSGAIAVHLNIGLGSVDVSVRDWGGGFQQVAAAGDRLRVGLPLTSALAARLCFSLERFFDDRQLRAAAGRAARRQPDCTGRAGIAAGPC
jgi:anti-sigma regulatory factor (Ser/Thr protein kinase)